MKDMFGISRIFLTPFSRGYITLSKPEGAEYHNGEPKI